MGKIPIGRVIGETFRFSFGKYFTLLGILWLPTLVLGLLIYGLMQPFLAGFGRVFHEMMLHPASPTAQNMMDDLSASGLESRVWLVQLVVVFFFVVIQVAMTKEILGLRSGPRFVYLSIGAADLIAVVSYILLYVLLYAAVFAVVLVAVILGIAVVFAAGSSLQNFDAKAMSGPLTAAFIGLAFVFELAIIYALVRLSFLIVPIAVAEKRIGLIRSWELTKGNFWRIIGIWLVTLLPLFVVEMAFLVALVAPMASSLGEAAHKGSQAAMDAQVQAMLRDYPRYLPWLWLVGFALSPVLYGLWLAPAAFAYRALVPPTIRLQPGADPAPPPDGGNLAPV